MATVPELPPEILRRLTLELVHEPDVEKVATSLSTHGVSEESIRAVGREILETPLFELARLAYVRLAAREWVFNALLEVSAGTLDVTELDVAPSREEFLTRFYRMNRPAHLRGLARSWPAITRWTPAYLKQSVGSLTIDVMMGRNKALTRFQAAEQRLTQSIGFGEFVDMVFQTERSNDFYLVAENDFFGMEGTDKLAEDFGLVEIVDISCPATDLTFWLGPAGTITPWHFDACNNMLIQLLGRKKVSLCPPYIAERMKQSTLWYAGHDLPAEGGHPCTIVELQPGDALFMPVGWWHKVESLDPSAMLSCTNFGVTNEFDKPLPSLG